MRPIFVMALMCLLVSGFAGCGENIGLRGKVTFSDTKEPLPCGEIHFTTESFLARAAIQPDGTYTVGTEKQGDGLPPGTYQIVIVNAVKGGEEPTEPATMDSRGMPASTPAKQLIDPKYKNKETSGLTLTVDKSTKVFDFAVDRFKQ